MRLISFHWTDVCLTNVVNRVPRPTVQNSTTSCLWKRCAVNSSSPGQNGSHFADDIFNCIFMNELFGISVRISLKFVHKGPNDNIPALVQIMAWRRPKHICGTGGRWVKGLSANRTTFAISPLYRYVIHYTAQSRFQIHRNALRLGQNCHRFAVDIFKCHFLHGMHCSWCKFHWS